MLGVQLFFAALLGVIYGLVVKPGALPVYVISVTQILLVWMAIVVVVITLPPNW